MVVKSCPTFDNVFVEIDIAVVFKCKDDDESIKNFVYNISMTMLKYAAVRSTEWTPNFRNK